MESEESEIAKALEAITAEHTAIEELNKAIASKNRQHVEMALRMVHAEVTNVGNILREFIKK